MNRTSPTQGRSEGPGSIGGLEAAEGLEAIDAADATDAVFAGPALARVLVVEDSREGGGRLATTLAAAGFAVRASADGLLGLHAFIRGLPDLIVASDRVGGLEVFELIRRVRELSDLPVVLVVRQDGTNERAAAARWRVDRVVVEERAVDELVPSVVALLPPPRSMSSRPRLTADRVRDVARSALRAELERLLVECRGNLAEVGRRMGKDRSTIRYHLRRFGMLVEDGARGIGDARIDGLSGSAVPS